MQAEQDIDKLTRVAPGTPMGEYMRRFWIPAGFSNQLSKPDGPPVRVKLLGEKLVMFRDTSGRVGLVAEACPHRTASMFFGRNEENGLRCVYHGIKFDVEGRCVDLPCAPAQYQDELKIKAYPCIERGDLIWTYMGPSELRPEFPELEWALLPASHRFVTRHIQECNWLQAFEGGFDAMHLTFLHSGVVDLRKGSTDKDRKVAPTRFELLPTDSGFVCSGGRELADGTVAWHVEIMFLPFHKIIPSVPRGAHVWVPIDDETTMLYSINFDSAKPLTDEAMEREYAWRGIHTDNIDGTDRAKANRDNDYLIDRDLQASGRSYTGLTGLGVQDCALQESMGPIADRSKEFLLPADLAVVRMRRLLLQELDNMAAGKPLRAIDPASYRVTSARFTSPASAKFVDEVKVHAFPSKAAAE
jgi:nitrite reductase/ring-hydroxylating ferredoxin subunit